MELTTHQLTHSDPILERRFSDCGLPDHRQWKFCWTTLAFRQSDSDNVSFQTSFTLGSSDFGERQIEVRFKDEAGNISKPFSDNITRLDTTPPQPLSFSLLGTAGNDNFSNSDNVSFIDNATDDVAPVGMYLSENSTTPLDNASGWQAYANTGTFNLSAGQGEKQVYLWFKDAANNISSYLTDTITFDNVSPTANGILINSGADNTTSSTVILSFDNVTGASHYFATDDASAPTPTATAQGWKLYPANDSDNFTLTGTGNREVRVWFRDEAGNISTRLIYTINFIGSINWGTNSSYLGVNIYTVDKGTPTLGTLTAYQDFCASNGQSYILDSHPGNGADYNSDSSNGDQTRFQAASDYMMNVHQPSMPFANYDNILVMHGSSPNCFAHNAETGSMHAFGGPEGTGYSYCRNGDTVAKQFHIYICK